MSAGCATARSADAEPPRRPVDDEPHARGGEALSFLERAPAVLVVLGPARGRIRQQGDVIARIKQYHEYVGHYHTAGNPGRNEIDDTQEINYPGIMRAIADTKYEGYVGQEFIPLRDARQSLAEAARLCDV